MQLLRHVVGDVLRRLRREQGRTLADVSAAARVSMAYLSEVERGRKEASSEVLAAICAALGITVLDLVARTHEEMLAAHELRTLTSVSDLTAYARPAGPGGTQVSLLAA